MPGAAINILLIDDHPVVREGYRRLLETDPDLRVIAEAADGEQGYAEYVTHRPAVVVLDLSLPGIGGLATLRRLCKRDADAKVLVFSIYDEEVYVQRAVAAGAKGYLTKRSAPREMICAVREIAGGGVYFGQDIADRCAGGGSPLDILSPREFEVFRLLAEGYNIAEIAFLLHISPKTAGVHQTRIMKKLDVSNQSQLTRMAIRLNLLAP